MEEVEEVSRIFLAGQNTLCIPSMFHPLFYIIASVTGVKLNEKCLMSTIGAFYFKNHQKSGRKFVQLNLL